MANLLQTLQAAGFRGEALRTAWAVAMAESGGNPRAFNPRGRDLSYGLFQINMLGAMGPDRRQRFGLSSNEDLYDPATNARVAFAISRGGTDWSPWTTFTGGAYKSWYEKFPGQAKSAAPMNAVTQRAEQAWATGPAGIVAGPNPAQLLQSRQQMALSFLNQAATSINGQPQDSNRLLQLAFAKQQLSQANAQYAAAEAQARQYGGTTQADGAGQVFQTGNAVKDRIISTAMAQLGKPYVWGAETPAEGGFDCSGLIDYAFRQAGIRLPGGRLTTYTARNLGVSVKGKPYQPGDWIIANGGKHMVMYVGNGQVIAAPRRGEVVQLQPISRFDGDIVDVRRVLR